MILFRNSRAQGCVASLVLLVMSLFATGCAAASPAAQAMVGNQVPNARLMMLSGEDVSIRPDDGRMKVLLFWATWCPYSKAAIEEFEALARQYRSRSDVVFYAVSIDRNQDLDILEGRIRDQNLVTVQHVFSGNDIQDEAFIALYGNIIPYSVVVGADGMVRFVDIGVSGLESYLSEVLRRS